MPDAVALAMVEALPATAPTVGWQTIGSIGASAYEKANSTDGAVIYTSHGFNGGPLVGLQTITPQGTVTTGPNASVVRRAVAGAWGNGKHYSIGGFNSSSVNVSTVEAYTPSGTNGASGVWSTVAALPAALGYSSATSVGNFVYVAGGQTATNVTSGTVTSALYRYDTVNNVWATLASMPAPRTQGAILPFGSKLYFLGGNDSSGNATTTVYVFDTTAGTWATSQPLSTAISSGAGAAVQGVAYLTAGNTVIGYNLTSGSAVTVSSTTPTSHGAFPGLVSIANALYYIAGSGTPNVDKLDLNAGTSYTAAVLGVKSLLNPLLSGVASALPASPPTVTADRNAYAQTVQTLKALAAL